MGKIYHSNVINYVKRMKDKFGYEIDAPLLGSYANEEKLMLKRADMVKDMFLDCGAFSVAHSGKHIDHDEYIKYVNQISDDITIGAALDVIPYPVLNEQTAMESAEGTYNNFLYSLEHLKDKHKLIPIYHYGEDPKYLQRLLDINISGEKIRYIGIGGRHGVSFKQQQDYLLYLTELVRNSSNPNVKVHLFGVTDMRLLGYFPYYSTDSASAVRFASFGCIYTTLRKPVAVTSRSEHRPQHINQLCEAQRKIVLEEVARFGSNLEDLMESEMPRIRHNMKVYDYLATQVEPVYNKVKTRKSLLG